MITFTGYGLLIIIGVYIISFFSASRITPSDASRIMQIIIIILTGILATAINYFIAKKLNKGNTKHSIGGLKLEYIVLFLGGFFLFLAFMMLYGEMKS